MKIKNRSRLSADELQREAGKGARFVYYSYAFSLLFVTIRRNSGIYLLEQGKNQLFTALPYTIVSLLFGWWAIPSGPRHTIECITRNWKGGWDITDELVATAEGYILFQEAEQRKKNLPV